MTSPAMPQSSLYARIKETLSSLSLSAKLAVLIAAGFLATFAVSFLLITANVRAMGLDFQSQNETLVASFLAEQIRLPLQHKDAERLENIYKPVAEKDRSLIQIDVVHVSGEHIAQYASGDNVPEGLQKLLDEALTNGEQVHHSSGNMNMVAVPVTSEDGETMLGAAGFVWGNGSFLNAQISEIKKSVAISALGALLGIAVIVYVISRVVVHPIQTLSNAMQTVSEQNYEIEISGTDRGDEIGIMAAQLAHFRDTLAKEKQLEAERQEESALRRKLFLRLGEGMSHLAAGRTDCPISVDEFASLDRNHVEICEDFNNVLVNLRDVLSTIVSTAESD